MSRTVKTRMSKQQQQSSSNTNDNTNTSTTSTSLPPPLVLNQNHNNNNNNNNNNNSQNKNKNNKNLQALSPSSSVASPTGSTSSATSGSGSGSGSGPGLRAAVEGEEEKGLLLCSPWSLPTLTTTTDSGRKNSSRRSYSYFFSSGLREAIWIAGILLVLFGLSAMTNWLVVHLQMSHYPLPSSPPVPVPVLDDSITTTETITTTRTNNSKSSVNHNHNNNNNNESSSNVPLPVLPLEQQQSSNTSSSIVSPSSSTTDTSSSSSINNKNTTTTPATHPTKRSRSEQDFCNHGLKLMLSGHSDLGLAEFQEGRRMYPNSSTLALHVADALATLHRYQEALEAYQTTRDLLLDQKQQKHPSQQQYDAVHQQHHNNNMMMTKAMTWIGVCHRRLGHKDVALKWFIKAVREGLPQRESRYHLTFSYYMDHRFVDAVKWLGETMKIEYLDDDFHLLFSLLGVLQHWELLAFLLEVCLEGECDFSRESYTPLRAQLQYAAALTKVGRDEEAQQVLQKAAEMPGGVLSLDGAFREMQQYLAGIRDTIPLVTDLPKDKSALQALHRELSDLFEPMFRSKVKAPAWSLLKRHVRRFQWPLPEDIVQIARATLELQKEALTTTDPSANSTLFDDNHLVELFFCLTLPIYSLEDCIFSAKVYAIRRKAAVERDGIRVMGYNDFPRDSYPRLSPTQPLRIGLFSGDVGGHPMLPLLYAFVRHTHTASTSSDMPEVAVQVTLYHTAEDPLVVEHMKQYVYDTKKCDRSNYGDCVQHARHNKIHVWLETTGSTGEGIPNIATAGAAPVGVLWAGFPGSMAMPTTLQYMVSDAYTVPPGSKAARLYPEKMLYVPGSWMISDTELLAEMVVSLDANYTREGLREQFGISSDGVVYSYFGRTWKIDDKLFGAWGKIVEKVPNSYLVLAYYSTDRATDPTYTLNNMRKAWTGMGLSDERFIVVPPFHRGEHIQVLRKMCDVALDTAIYGGGTTAFEALYAGLPLVHFTGGSKMMQRAGGSLLVSAGLANDLIAKDFDDYVNIAVRLGIDPVYRQRIKQYLGDIRSRRVSSVLFQPEIAVTAMVRGLMEAYERWKAGLPPQTINTVESTVSGGFQSEL